LIHRFFEMLILCVYRTAASSRSCRDLIQHSDQSSHPPRRRDNSLPVAIVPLNGRDVQPQVQVVVGTTVESDLGFFDLNNTVPSQVGDEEGGIDAGLQKEKNMEILCTK
jgi:hypothetical protein